MPENLQMQQHPTHKVTCIYEPRGYHGLEGYQVGQVYDAVKEPGYWKVWPVSGQAYYETCGSMAFNKYFKVNTTDV